MVAAADAAAVGRAAAGDTGSAENFNTSPALFLRLTEYRPTPCPPLTAAAIAAADDPIAAAKAAAARRDRISAAAAAHPWVEPTTVAGSGIRLVPGAPAAVELTAAWAVTAVSVGLRVVANRVAAAAATVAAALSGAPGALAGLAAYTAQFRAWTLPRVASVPTNTPDGDALFVRRRLAGAHPLTLRRVQPGEVGLGTPFPVTDAHLANVAGCEGGDTLAAATETGRLFLVDYNRSAGYIAAESAARGMTPLDEEMATAPDGRRKVAYAPKALFVVPPFEKTSPPPPLAPVAIQVAASPTHAPVLTPRDGGAWAVAKLVVNAADGTEHELRAHMALTHYLMNSVAAAAARTLDPAASPVWRLLSPHFDGLFTINNTTPSTLLGEGNLMHQTLTGTAAGHTAYVAHVLHTTPFNSLFPRTEMTKRGVLDASILRDYPYRDDGLAIWDALHEYVAAVLAPHYPDDAAVAADTEVAAWAAELSSRDGARVAGFGEPAPPDNDGTPACTAGVIRSVAYLVDVCTFIIWTSSAHHAAINFSQHDYLAYAPACPLSIWGVVPGPGEDGPLLVPVPAAAADSNKNNDDGSDDNDVNKDDAAASVATAMLPWLPPPPVASAQAELMAILASVRVTRLGRLPWTPRRGGWHGTPEGAAAVAALAARLDALDAEIAAREAGAEWPYEYLRPSRVPRSVNI